MYVRSKIPLQILQDSCSKSCKTLVWFLHARLCTVHILHGSKTCKKSCKGRLTRLLQGLVRLWPLLLQYARFLSKYIRFSCKMCQILMQASLQASCKSLMYGVLFVRYRGRESICLVHLCGWGILCTRIDCACADDLLPYVSFFFFYSYWGCGESCL